MKRTWRNIIIISLIFIAIEAAVFFIFVMPYYRTYKIFRDIENGKWQSASESYAKLSDRRKSEVQSKLEHYGIYICEKYIEGDMTFAQAAASFDAINSIDETEAIMDKYMADVSYNEYKTIVKNMNIAGAAYDNKTLYSMMDSLRLVQRRMQNEDRERALVELINEEYVVYLNEGITGEQMRTFASTISGLSQYDAYNYASVISNNVSCVEIYRGYYTEAQSCVQNQRYFDAIKICENVFLDEKDTLYAERFSSLYNEARETGETYYGALLENYIAAGDNNKAVELMNNIKEFYGDEFDLTDIKQRIAEDWQLAYIDCIENIENTLPSELALFETGKYIMQYEYDKLKPDSVVLHDIDGNGIPEMFLYNSSYKDDSYIGCFIYTYTEDGYKFVNYVNVKSFCRDSYLIGFPIAFGRGTGDECSLVQYDGSTLTQISYCQEIGGAYYIDGAESNDVDYLSARTSILSHADAYNVGNSKGVSLEDGETYILTFK